MLTQPTRNNPSSVTPESILLTLALALLYVGFLATLWFSWPTTEHDPKPDTANTYTEVLGSNG